MSISFVIVGAGWIADFYLKALNKLDSEFVLKGCVGNPSIEGQKRLKEKCDLWNVKAYSSYDEVLKDTSIDAVAIFTPTSMHYSQVKEAIEHKKHVLVEKPVALNVEQLDVLDKLAKENSVTVFPGHNFVYRPVIKKAKEIIDSGKLGAISYSSFRAAHFIPEDHASGWRKDFSKSGGGAMMDSGTHLVYQFLYLIGKPERLCCFSSKRHYLEMDGEDTCLISLFNKGGIVSQIFQSWSCSDPSAGEIRIQGDKGTILISDSLYFNGELVETDSSYESSFFHILKAFYDTINKNQEPISDIQNAKITLKLIQDAYKSANDKSIKEFV
ncbi:MAG: Gfo/Idh/MocA family oxidoreductase [Sphaerochaetaceae bacterium]|nr:Gfo/Idh/MocA family oxidoreductase [Sphaerochaetaceae bacterium]